ncbi:hypothetical protein ACFU7Y_42495 [Kitasatospora sp. NPDC057542]|uniref:hypothetical protein n=1 Tax=Streptomycetaceae TaxID=2062 RepID=UPI001CCFB429|nr:hypothetical protein [Streptomyces sp. LS1784]
MPVAVTASVLATGLTACGTVQQLSAAQKVSKAFDKVGDGKSVGFTLSIAATPEQVAAFANTGEHKGGKGLVGSARGVDREMDEKTAKAISGLSVSVAISADKPLKEVEAFKNAGKDGKNTDLTLDKSVRISYLLSDRSGTALLEYRQIDGTGYLHADAKGLVKLVGEDPSSVDELRKELPENLKPVGDVLAGTWVSIDLQSLADQAKQSDGKKAAPSAAPTVDPELGGQLLNSIKDVLGRTVTYEDKGKKDGTEHLWISAPARQLVDEMYKAVKPLSAKFPKQFGEFPDQAPSDVPDRRIGVDLYLKNGDFSSATFDLAQLADKVEPGVNFPVKLAFNQTAPNVQAPSDAVKLTNDQLMDAVLGLATSGGPGGFDPEDTGDLPLAPPLTDAQLKELAGLGITDTEARAFNRAGLTFEDIKEIAQEDTPPRA